MIPTEDEERFTNHYHCERCNTEWEDTWSCTCNDRCPECNAETEPYTSEDNEAGEDVVHVTLN